MGGKTGKDHKRFCMALVRTLWGFDLLQREKGTSSCGRKREALGDRCLWRLTHFTMSDLNSLVRWESLQPKPFLETQHLSVPFYWPTSARVLLGTEHRRVQPSNTLKVLGGESGPKRCSENASSGLVLINTAAIWSNKRLSDALNCLLS